MGELRVIEEQEALEALLEQIETWILAEQAATYAARYSEHGLEMAELDVYHDPLPDEEELEWISLDQVKVAGKLPKP
ncbi:hypothetical protein [Agrobacterium sp. NPDC089420]|uniref:hypothetical protein n=1 Tax=Agrobacterium sp. NPDC089420 TaxID=3363918 RepID=UPI00385151F6